MNDQYQIDNMKQLMDWISKCGMWDIELVTIEAKNIDDKTEKYIIRIKEVD